MLVGRCAEVADSDDSSESCTKGHAAASNRSVELKNLFHPTSPARRSNHPSRFSESTMAVGALARQTFSYIGRDFPARVIASCVNTALALPIRKRLSISSQGKL